ncbi:hypothetical protein [Novosphingobium beihaiensis]|uniref:Uncharacterized protein n=1 Tax=Novosphingobium beihaiensis TaxID=2930389 RepID=A0ABT0BLM2_9SPHN|nr:hypothetical protein [Novosphingobium beihaiensis]MCJ2185966.1 hypothetical protein [Novosphingobium beihaiensis]
MELETPALTLSLLKGLEAGVAPACFDKLRTDRHSEDGEPKMVILREPERSVLHVREHRKRAKAPFAGRQG